MPKLHFDMWVLIAHYLVEEAITLAHAFRGDLTLADALCDVSENYYLARWEMSHELECYYESVYLLLHDNRPLS
jgi:hypothetical protein